MSLKKLILKKEYRSYLDNIAREFLVPALTESISYKRAVGFFSSSALCEALEGITGLVKNGGTIKIIASPYLSNEDIQEIDAGYSQRKEIIEKTLMKKLLDASISKEEKKLNLLANLIADGILDFKIAITTGHKSTGMYHEKVGIFEDPEGNTIAFSGSMNESANAFFENYETIDVYTSWGGDAERVQNKQLAFDSIWNGTETNIETFDFISVKEAIITKYKKSNLNKALIDIESVSSKPKEDNQFFRTPANITLHDYQSDAIDNWVKRNCCGIFDMATGSGKTYTALGALSTLSRLLHDQIAVIIIAPYQHLVEQWVEDIIKFNVKPIVAYSYPGNNWRRHFEDAVISYNLGTIKNFCIIATNSTFVLDDFQRLLGKFRKNYCFVADEAHNIGAKKISERLPSKARYRLGLSATIERHGDEEGTEKLYRYFGKKCITFSLEDAIAKGFLTSYYYFPVVVTLSDEEREHYQELTAKINKYGDSLSENIQSNPALELLLIKRARIVAGCHSKVEKLIEIMTPFKNENHILVYCGATKYDNSNIDDDQDIRQIEKVTYSLFHDLEMKVRKFTSEENMSERQEIRDMFEEGTDLQVVTAIKCLDEGVNIPAIQKAFILASSTNPKEYIQRRGRVLRKAAGKEFAIIYDFVTLPRPLEKVRYCSPEEIKIDLSLVKREFQRIDEFSSASRNPFEADSLKDSILNTYKIDC